MVLYGAGVYGDESAAYPDFPATVYKDPSLKYDENWNEYWVTWDSLNYPSGDEFHSFSVTSASDDTVIIPLDNDWVYDWIAEYNWVADTSSHDTIPPVNAGFLFDFDCSAGFIKDFYSSENADSLKPHLLLHLTVVDTATGEVQDSVVTINTNDDVYIAKDNVELSPDRLYIGQSAGYRSLFLFDLSSFLPDFGAFINKAEFTFFIDTTHSLYTGEVSSITIEQMTDSLWLEDPSIYNHDPDYYGNIASVEGDSVVLTMTNLMFDWVLHPQDNFGFAVLFVSEGNDLTRVPLYPPGCSENLAKRPYIHLIYTMQRGEE